MSEEWVACGRAFKRRAGRRARRINRLLRYQDAHSGWPAIEAAVKAAALMAENIRDQRAELHRVGFPGY